MGECGSCAAQQLNLRPLENQNKTGGWLPRVVSFFSRPGFFLLCRPIKYFRRRRRSAERRLLLRLTTAEQEIGQSTSLFTCLTAFVSVASRADSIFTKCTCTSAWTEENNLWRLTGEKSGSIPNKLIPDWAIRSVYSVP